MVGGKAVANETCNIFLFTSVQPRAGSSSDREGLAVCCKKKNISSLSIAHTSSIFSGDVSPSHGIPVGGAVVRNRNGGADAGTTKANLSESSLVMGGEITM